MANITQTVHSLTSGISQQPDEQKIPGQVRDMSNAFPNITQGLEKRPAGKWISSLPNSTYDGKWFHYYRDENEQYIGQIKKDGTVLMFDCQTGVQKNVVNGIGNNNYLTHTNGEDIQTLTLNDFTYITNRSKETKMSSTILEPLGNFGKEAYIDLKKIAYARQYALDLYTEGSATQTVTTATRIDVELVKSSNNYCDPSDKNPDPAAVTNGFMAVHANRLGGNSRCNANAGDGRDAFAPNVGTRIFAITNGGTLQDTAAPGGVVNSFTTPILYSDTNYAYQVAVFNGYSGTTPIPVTGRTPANLYFRIRTTGQSVPFTTGSGSNQTTEYQARYTTTHDLLHGGEGWEINDQFYVYMKDGLYLITVKEVSKSIVKGDLALVRMPPTPFDTKTNITSESILGSLRHGITGSLTSNTGNGFTVTQIGSGLHISRATPFQLSTSVPELINGIGNRVDDVGDLPRQCKHGMVVKVANSEADEDDYYVKFLGNNNEDGEGVWEECAKPGRLSRFDYDTMPVTLIRTANGQFRLAQLDGAPYHISVASAASTGATIITTGTSTVNMVNHGFEVGDEVYVQAAGSASGTVHTVTEVVSTLVFKFDYIVATNYPAFGQIEVGLVYRHPKWEDAIVGDDVTNPEPSFIGQTINKLTFFRNRLAILSDENVILSRPGDFFNFFSESAIQFVASDPIDISASSTYPAILHDAIQVNTGLILFAESQQFMLTTDSDNFTPLTAKINNLSTYNFNIKTNPISLGTTIGFLDNAGKHSRFMEMARILREGEPEVIEQSAVVSTLFNDQLKFISNSRENSVVFFSEENSSTLYGFKYFDSVEDRKLASWFRWTINPDAGAVHGKGQIKYHCMQDDALYVVMATEGTSSAAAGNQRLYRFDLKVEASTALLAENRIHLDNLIVDNATDASGANYFTKSYNFSNATGKTSIFYTPRTTINGQPLLSGDNNLVAFGISGTNIGQKQSLIYNGPYLNSGQYQLLLDGDWTGTTFMIGKEYEMSITLPTIYYTSQKGQRFISDTRANTVIHRVKLAFGPVGTFEVDVARKGRPTFTQGFELKPAGEYLANTSIALEDNLLRTIPIYDKNTNTSITIKSKHPEPATIHQLTWEGVYNTNHYQSV
jgi:hypothetical protein